MLHMFARNWIMELVVAGHHNREIGEALGISSRTASVHKTRVMQELRVDSIAQLIRMSPGVLAGGGT